MSYAIISLGGKQYRVREGQRLLVDRLATADGKTLTPDVLLVGGAGAPALAPKDVTVTLKVVGQQRGPKIRIGKYKKRTGYKRHTGFRAALTQIEVESIAAGKRAAARPKAVVAAEPAAATAVEPEQVVAAEPEAVVTDVAAVPKTTRPAKPSAAARPKAPAKPRAASKPEAAAKPKAPVKPKAAAKPKAPVKPKAAAKPRAAKPKADDAPKPAKEDES
jgi:ribosomal protein L21